MEEYTALEILKMNSPYKLFFNDIDKSKNVYRNLVKVWHPDVNKNPEAENVFKHITILYNQALDRIKNGVWITENKIEFSTSTGSKYRIKYNKKYSFELGEVYISNTIITYIVNEEYEDFYRNGIDNIKRLNFIDDNLKKQFEPFLPKIKKEFKTVDKKNVLVLNKPNGLYSLREILEYFNNRIDPRHIAWITSRLYNITCYLFVHKLTHNDISLDSCFIDPTNHTLYLLGGWWYSKVIDTKMIGLPKRTINIIPQKILEKKISNNIIDLELVKLTCRELSGDSTGMKLYLRKDIPQSMINWFKEFSLGNAIENFEQWDKVLDKSFGERKFIKMEIKKGE